jgi:predicted ATPase
MAGSLFVNSVIFNWNKVSPDSYVRGIEAIKDLSELVLTSPVTIFSGENGTGKSTLLEAIAIAWGFNPEGGTKNYHFSTHDSHSELCDAIILNKSPRKAKGGYFLRAESFYNVATKEEEYARDDPRGIHMDFHLKSHGESFLAAVQQYFKGSGFYILDEPEAALSPQRQLTLLLEIARCVKEGAQFIIVTHSPVLLALPQAQILSFDEGTVHPITYEETGSYRITSMFMSGRERILHHLLDEE